MTPTEFVAKWRPVTLSERTASQEHFIDLCHLLSQPTPASHDATGAEYTFEKGVSVDGPASKGSAGAHGFADVWWKGKFAIDFAIDDFTDSATLSVLRCIFTAPASFKPDESRERVRSRGRNAAANEGQIGTLGVEIGSGCGCLKDQS